MLYIYHLRKHINEKDSNRSVFDWVYFYLKLCFMRSFFKIMFIYGHAQKIQYCRHTFFLQTSLCRFWRLLCPVIMLSWMKNAEFIGQHMHSAQTNYCELYYYVKGFFKGLVCPKVIASYRLHYECRILKCWRHSPIPLPTPWPLPAAQQSGDQFSQIMPSIAPQRQGSLSYYLVQ